MKKPQPNLTIRAAVPEDGPVCGQICYDAFATISAAHGFPCDLPNAEAAAGFLTRIFATPGCYCIVAESEGRIVGSNCLDERSVVAGVGPITINPAAQSAGIGRQLMQAAMDRANEKGAAGIRLVQAAFHNRSLSLYASMGFDVREPLACMQGRTSQRNVPGCTVRPAGPADINACNLLSHRIHGFSRGADLEQSIQGGTAKIVQREGHITAYTTNLAFFGHATAETDLDLQALITSVESFSGPGILVPTRNNALFRWCLSNGMRVVQPMTLMSIGLYNEPSGSWLPSILF